MASTYPVIYPFAVETNFPAGGDPWDGQPLALQPPADYFPPNTSLDAEELNYVFGKHSKVDASVLAWLGGIQWRPEYQAQGFATPGTWSAYDVVSWDQTTLKWLVCGTTASTGYTRVITGRGGSAWDWVSFNAQTTQGGVTPTSVCRGIEPGLSPPNKIVYVGGPDGSNAGHLLKFDTSANTFADVALADNANVTDVKVHSVSGQVIVFTGGTSSADCHISRTANQGSSFTNIFSFSVPVASWLTAQQPNNGAILACSTNAGGTNSGGSGFDVYTTTNGTTWVHTNVTGSGMGATEIPTALAWGADASGTGCWIVQTFVGGLYGTYRSYDGVTWTSLSSNVSTLIGANNAKVKSMKALGSAWVAVVDETPNARLIYSLDGAVTWQVSQSSLVNTGTGTCHVAGGETGFMALSHTWLVPSMTYGVSSSVGLV